MYQTSEINLRNSIHMPIHEQKFSLWEANYFFAVAGLIFNSLGNLGGLQYRVWECFQKLL